MPRIDGNRPGCGRDGRRSPLKAGTFYDVRVVHHQPKQVRVRRSRSTANAHCTLKSTYRRRVNPTRKRHRQRCQYRAIEFTILARPVENSRHVVTSRGRDLNVEVDQPNVARLVVRDRGVARDAKRHQIASHPAKVADRLGP